jgi:hypothetical protein
MKNGFDQLIDVVWRLLVLKRLDHSEEIRDRKKNLNSISLFEYKLDNNFGTEGVPYFISTYIYILGLTSWI